MTYPFSSASDKAEINISSLVSKKMYMSSTQLAVTAYENAKKHCNILTHYHFKSFFCLSHMNLKIKNAHILY